MNGKHWRARCERRAHRHRLARGLDRAPTADHLAAIVEIKPEIVLLGTGKRFVFAEPRLLARLRRGHGVEVMDNGCGMPHLQHPAGRRPQRPRGHRPLTRKPGLTLFSS